VNLVVAGRRCVVVGAGRVAVRKVRTLLDAGADVHVVAPEVDAEIAALARDGRVALSARPFAPDDLDGAWLAITATGDPRVDGAVFDAGEARRVWVNAADDPANCSVTLLSVIRRGDLAVGIGTGGRSPAYAAWLRRRLDEEIGPEHAVVLDLLAEARAELQEAGRPTEDADWRRALDSGMLELVRAGRIAEAKELLRTCLSPSSV
jgi:precorrin-2 dehydrogenase